MSVPVFTDKQYSEVVDFYDARINRSLVPLIREKILQPGRKYESFLDVGPGMGTLTREVAPAFQHVDVIEPNRDYLDNFKQPPAFKVCHDLLEDADIAKGQYDLILCSHIYYHIPKHLWKKCLMKTYEGLKPGGSLVLAMSASRGDWQKHLYKLTGEEVDNFGKSLLQSVVELKLPCQSHPAVVTITAQEEEFQMFHNMVRLFSFVTAKFEHIEPSRCRQVEIEINEYARNCFDPVSRKYVLTQEEDYICIQKPSDI